MSWLLAALLSCVVGTSSPDCMIVEFTTDNCGPCQQLQPALEKLKSEGWIVRTVNAAREPLMIKKFSVESVPTLVLISGGKEIDRIVGAAPYEKILPRLAKLMLTANAMQAPESKASNAIAGNDLRTTRTNPAARAVQWPVAEPKQTLAPNPALNSELTVRGQSPSSGAFPMLAAASSALTAIPTSQSIAEKFDTPSKLLAASSASFATPSPLPATPVSLPSNPSSAPALIPANSASLPQPVTSARNNTPMNFQAAVARAEAATVRIRVDEENTTAYGTGTVIDVHGDEALVLTCGHLFREMKLHSQLTIDLFPSHSQPVNVEAKLIDFTADAGDVDIGLISFKLPYAIEPVSLLPQQDALAVGQPAFSFGCDHGENPTRRDTQVRSINRYLGAPNVEIAGAPAVGRSGGGLFDHQGRLIGVCNAADAESDEGIYAAAEVVYAQVNRLGLGHLFNKNSQVPATEAAPTAQASAVQLAINSATVPVQANPVQANPIQANSPASSQPNDSQITCIIRGPNGQEQVVRVASPSPDLLDAIYRQAAGGSNQLR